MKLLLNIGAIIVSRGQAKASYVWAVSLAGGVLYTASWVANTTNGQLR